MTQIWTTLKIYLNLNAARYQSLKLHGIILYTC